MKVEICLGTGGTFRNEGSIKFSAELNNEAGEHFCLPRDGDLVKDLEDVAKQLNFCFNRASIKHLVVFKGQRFFIFRTNRVHIHLVDLVLFLLFSFSNLLSFHGWRFLVKLRHNLVLEVAFTEQSFSDEGELEVVRLGELSALIERFTASFYDCYV